jgi:phage host-nuclease inhibitor protein Gam
MSQPPVTVTYPLEDILGQIQQQLVHIDQKSEQRFNKLENRLDNLQQEVTDLKIHVVKLETELKGEIASVRKELKGGIATLNAEVQGIGKRLDTQEFINRSVMVGFILASTAGAIKFFFPEFPH